MSTSTAKPSVVEDPAPVAIEFGVIAAILAGLYGWNRLIGAATNDALARAAAGGLVLDTIVTGGLLVGGVVGFTVVYARARDVEVGRSLPSRADGRRLAGAVLVPVVLVATTKLVGVLTGVQYNALTKTAVPADPALGPIVVVTGLGLLVTVPVLVVVCQVLVQGTFERVVDRTVAVGLTTLVAGVAMTSTTGGLTAVPDRGRLLATGLLAIGLAVGVYGHARLDRTALRYLAYLPALVVVTLVAVAAVMEIESVAGALFAGTHLAVFAVAADTYDRTDSLFGPAVAYLTLIVANRVVVVGLEAGMQSW